MDRGILFSGPMVRALLAGTKTQTRRIVKPNAWVDDDCDAGYDGQTVGVPPYIDKSRCPYGQAGDRLWVRERWRIGAFRQADGAFPNRFALDFLASPELARTPWCYPPIDAWTKLSRQSLQECAKAAAAGSKDLWEDGDGWGWEHGKSPCRWRPSIHMPRWASRITLEITGVRVERLRDISEADAIAEGIERKDSVWKDYRTDGGWSCPINSYWSLWDSINGPGSWDANPWVWVVEFKRIAQP